jgi:hypothetical protein
VEGHYSNHSVFGGEGIGWRRVVPGRRCGVFLNGMGGLTVWRQGQPRLAGAGRAGVIAAAVFAVTGAAAVLVTALSDQPWPPVLSSVLILAPGLYLAWKAVPASRRRRWRRAEVWHSADLACIRSSAVARCRLISGGPMMTCWTP